MEDLEADPGNAGKEEQRDDVRVDQRVQQAREEAGLDVVDLRAGEMQRVALRLRLVAVQLPKQRRQRWRHDVDDVLLQRFERGNARRLAHRALREFRVPAVCLGEGDDRRDGVVDRLLPQVLVEISAAGVDRRRGADVRLRRHREHVCGFGDPQSGRCGPRAVGCDIHDHGDRARELLLVDLAHRGQEAAWCVEDDHGRVVALVLRVFELVIHPPCVTGLTSRSGAK